MNAKNFPFSLVKKENRKVKNTPSYSVLEKNESIERTENAYPGHGFNKWRKKKSNSFIQDVGIFLDLRFFTGKVSGSNSQKYWDFFEDIFKIANEFGNIVKFSCYIDQGELSEFEQLIKYLNIKKINVIYVQNRKNQLEKTMLVDICFFVGLRNKPIQLKKVNTRNDMILEYEEKIEGSIIFIITTNEQFSIYFNQFDKKNATIIFCSVFSKEEKIQLPHYSINLTELLRIENFKPKSFPLNQLKNSETEYYCGEESDVESEEEIEILDKNGKKITQKLIVID